jgi:hypothetical protein
MNELQDYLFLLTVIATRNPLYTGLLITGIFSIGYYFNKMLSIKKAKKIKPKTPSINMSLIQINNNLGRIVKILRLRKPGMVFLTFYKGNDNMLKFVLTLPTKSAVDVVKREVTVVVDGADPVVVELEGDALETGEFSGADGASVTGALVDVDDAGNRSPAREFTFALADTFAPPQPGEVGVRVTGEE